MKIGDLWVKLGLKKDEFSKGLQEAGNEVSGSGGLLGKLNNFKVGALAVWTAVAAGAVAMADKFAHTSQRLGDIWDQTTEGLKASWKTFVAAVNSTDFSNLGKRMADSFRAAKNVAMSSDAEFEVMNSINLRKSAMQEELAQLRVRAQNQKLSQKERIAAANEYLTKIKKFYDDEADYRKKHAYYVENAYLTNAGVRETEKNRQLLQNFLTDVAPDRQTLEALDEFKKAGYRYSSEAQKQILDAIQEKLGVSSIANLSKLANYYQSTADEDVKPVVDAITAANAAKAAFDEETRRVQSLANQAVTMGSGGGKNAGKSLDDWMEEAQARIDANTEKMWDHIDDVFDDMEPVKFQPLEIVPPDFSEWNEFYAKFKHDLDLTQELLDGFKEAAIQGFSDSVQELLNQMAGLSEANPGRVFQALLDPIADMAVKAGEIIMAEGLATIAAKSALETFGETGWGAVAAGAALIAAGAAAKTGLAALAKGGGNTATTSVGSGGGSAAQTQTIQTEMTVYVTGRISGNDILISGQKTQNSLNR